MKKREFVGIDLSKQKIDVRLQLARQENVFDNKLSGFKKMLKWIAKSQAQDTSLFFCFEHTGMYAFPLLMFLEKEELEYVQVSGLQVKKSLGIQRGKNDRIDAKRLAEYAYLHREQLRPHKIQSDCLPKLKSLLALRSRIVRQRAGYKASVKEYKSYLALKETDLIIHSQKRIIIALTLQIEAIEKEIKQLIASDEKILKQFQLATSVKGMGLICASYMIVLTNCFTDFKTWRKFACYAGSAPFEHQSGTSIKGKTKISHYANKQMKTLLTNAVKSAIRHDKELGLYYKKRIAEGKHKKVAVNIIRNKLISRVFATVRRGTPYVDLVKYAA